MKKERILIAGLGCDDQDRELKLVAKFLQDCGYEVIYTGFNQGPERIVSAALQEAVDMIGLAVPGSSRDSIVPEVMKQLRAKGLGDVPVFGTDNLPDMERPLLKEHGLKAFFRSETPQDALWQLIGAEMG